MWNSRILFALIIIAALACKSQNPASDTASRQHLPVQIPEPLTVAFPSLDSLYISANVYETGTDSPVILLCHQAGFNKAEYDGIAQRLVILGFNCIAIDQRSGGPLAGHMNETALRAKEVGLPTDYMDAEQDIIAAIQFASLRYDKPVILWGSSYSATIALYIAAESDLVSAVLAFSPGNYLSEYKGDLQKVLTILDKPIFITSSRREAPTVSALMKGVELSENQTQFIPTLPGHHGSRALWDNQKGSGEYWQAVIPFLNALK